MGDSTETILILIVGDVQRWVDLGRDLPQIAQITYCEFSDLTKDLLNKHRPHHIFSPLVSENFDIIDLAVRLQKLRYGGALRALIPNLPNPQYILSEILALCPDLDVDLIEVTPIPSPVFH